MTEKTPSCTGCGKCYYRKQRFVGGRGNINAPLVIVGESPGTDELVSQKPFTGPSGRILQAQLDKLGLKPEDYWITNAMQCIPVKVDDAKKNQTHMANAVRVCNNRLMAEIGAAPRKVILAAGNAALWSVTGQTDTKITQVRGRLYKSQHADVGVMGTVHPAFLLRGGAGYTQKFKEDIEYAVNLSKGGVPKQWVEPKYWICETEDDIRDVRRRLHEDCHEYQELHPGIPKFNQTPVGCDIETAGFNHRHDDILCYGISANPHKVYIIPEVLVLSLASKELLEDEDFHWIGHNWKFDVKFLRYRKIKARQNQDTMLLSYVQNENRGIHDLDQVASDVLGAPPHKHILDKYLPNRRTSYRVVPRKLLHKYLAFDVGKTISIFYAYWPQVEGEKWNKMAYNDLYMPAAEMLAEVEMNGICVNQKQVKENSYTYRKKIWQVKKDLDALTMAKFGRTYNPASPQQMQDLLWNQLGLRPMGTSTDEDHLKEVEAELRDRHIVCQELKLLMDYRKAAKIYGTFIRPLIPMAERTEAERKKKDQKVFIQEDGLVYATFKIHGTRTGRLSSNDPNLQNQPRLTDIRNQFMARTGLDGIQRWLMEVDYNQAELRSLAVMSGDPALLNIYLTGKNIHYEVSMDLWGKDWLQRYTEEHKKKDQEDYDLAKFQYIRTKAVNFGIIYGREAPSLAEEFNITTWEAQAMIDGWASKFPVAWAFIQKCRMAPQLNQTILTVYGRRKRATVAARENINSLMNEAANFPHQSTASDYTLDSATRLYKPLRTQFDARIVNLIHDAIYIDFPPIPEVAFAVAKMVVSEMEATPRMKGVTAITFEAEPEVGISWGSLHKMKGKDLPEFEAWMASQPQSTAEITGLTSSS